MPFPCPRTPPLPSTPRLVQRLLTTTSSCNFVVSRIISKFPNVLPENVIFLVMSFKAGLALIVVSVSVQHWTPELYSGEQCTMGKLSGRWGLRYQFLSNLWKYNAMYQSVKIKDNDFCEGLSFQQCTTVFPILLVVSGSPLLHCASHIQWQSSHTSVHSYLKTSALCIFVSFWEVPF